VHDEGAEKPFTVSGLMRGDSVHFGDLEAGDGCWLRFTELSAALEAYRAATAAQLAGGTRRTSRLTA